MTEQSVGIPLLPPPPPPKTMPATTYGVPPIKTTEPNSDHYVAAVADMLTAATLSKPEARKAAVRAVLESYFPATGETPKLSWSPGSHFLVIAENGQIEEWEGATYRGAFMSLQGAADGIKARAQA